MAVATIKVTEYFHANLGHYFITANPDEVAKLDSGVISGWARTGETFPAYAPNVQSVVGSSPVCRFYGRPEAGLDSHFYSASPAECAAVAQRFSSAWVRETDNAYYVLLPDPVTGECRSGSVPVYRLFNNRVDANHRYTTSFNIRSQMISAGWISEGYGATGVAMCVGEVAGSLSASANLRLRVIELAQEHSIVSLSVDEVTTDGTLRFLVGDVFVVQGQPYRVRSVVAEAIGRATYSLDRPSLGDIVGSLRISGRVALSPGGFIPAVPSPKSGTTTEHKLLPSAACDSDGCGVRVSLDNKVPEANLKGEITVYTPTIAPDIEFDGFSLVYGRLQIEGRIKVNVEASSTKRFETPPILLGRWLQPTPLTAATAILLDVPLYVKFVGEPGMALKASGFLYLDEWMSVREAGGGTHVERSSNTRVSASADPMPLGEVSIGAELSVSANLDIQASLVTLPITGSANYVDLIGEVSAKTTVLGACGQFTPKVRAKSSMFVAKPTYWMNWDRDERIEEELFVLEKTLEPTINLNTACSIDVKNAVESPATCYTVVDGLDATPTLFISWPTIPDAEKYTIYLDGAQSYGVFGADVDALAVPRLKAGHTYFVEVKATTTSGKIRTVLAKDMRIPSDVCKLEEFSVGRYVATPCWGGVPRIAMSVLGEEDATYAVFQDGKLIMRSGDNGCSVKGSGAFVSAVVEPGSSHVYYAEITRKNGSVERTDGVRVTVPVDACRF